jgi:PAS domain S-box-containing protein
MTPLEAVLESVIDSLADPFYVLDNQSRFVYVNRRAQAMWGKPREALIGQNIWEVFPQGVTTQAYQEIQQAVATQQPGRFETFSAFLNAWVEVNVYPNQQGVAIYFRDITARKAVESALLETKERLRLVMDSAADYAIYALDTEGRIYSWSAGAERIFGYSESEIVGQYAAVLYPPEDHDLPAQEMRKAIELGYVENERWLARKNGSRFFASGMMRLIHDDEGNLRGFARVSRDVTGRRLLEDERSRLTALLEAERQRLSSIVTNVPGIIWESYLDAATQTAQIQFISAYLETLLGYTVEEALSTPNFWDSVIHPEDVERVKEEMAKTRGGATQVITFRALHKGGRVVDLEGHVTGAPDSGHARGVMMDVSERQRFIQAQARYAQMLRRSNEELQQFAYIASHDLQEPLRMVTSYLQLLEQRYAARLDADAREFISFAVDGAARMRELINALLAYSRVERSEAPFEEMPAQVALDTALANLALKIEDSGATITRDPLPSLKADAVQMAQLFQNLISNALKFHGSQPPRVHIGVAREGDEWRFSVRDHGIGIAPEHLQRIFVIFQRLHQRDEYPGSGIGLAICKKVVERHGGRIWVESTPGEGATFYFTIPV